MKKSSITTAILFLGYLSFSQGEVKTFFSGNGNDNARTEPISRVGTGAFGVLAPSPPYFAPQNPFTEASSIPLTLFLNNKDQDFHKNFGILKQGTFGQLGYMSPAPSNIWLDLGLSSLDYTPYTNNPKRIFVPDDWGLRLLRNGVQGNFGIRETKNCSNEWQDNNPVLSWTIKEPWLTGDQNKYLNFYIDHYSDYNSNMAYKRNIMKLMRNGNVGIGLPTYNLNFDCNSGNAVSYTRDLNYEEFPLNLLDIEGALAVGIGYSGNFVAPSNGLLVQGKSGFGLTNPTGFMHVFNSDVNTITFVGEHSTTDDFGYNILAKNGDVTTKALASQMIGSSSDDFVIMANGQSGFAQTIDPSYTMAVNGNAINTGGWTVSDLRFKQNISKINNSLELIMKIRGVRYNYIPDSKKTGFYGGKQISINMNFDYEKQQIGFIAQELEAVVPELVKTDINGYKAVNYSQMVALLTEGIKEQQIEIENLKQEIQDLKSNSNINNPNINSELNKSWLKQNNPNPFSQNCNIEMFISQNSHKVSLRIYDLTGIQLKSYNIIEKGLINFNLSSNEIRPGKYLYSLIIDNIVIDTKTLVILD